MFCSILFGMIGLQYNVSSLSLCGYSLGGDTQE